MISLSKHVRATLLASAAATCFAAVQGQAATAHASQTITVNQPGNSTFNHDISIIDGASNWKDSSYYTPIVDYPMETW